MTNTLKYHKTPAKSDATCIHLIRHKDWKKASTKWDTETKDWLKLNDVTGAEGDVIYCPKTKKHPARVLASMADNDTLWNLAFLPKHIPAGSYYFDTPCHDASHLAGWALDQYHFTRYKESHHQPRILLCDDKEAIALAEHRFNAYALARDLINTPPNDMGPSHLADAAREMCKELGAKYSQIVGDKLLEANFPLVHAVGRAAENAPRLIDIRWGKTNHPKVTLVGKGVCFDTGGLDLKTYSSMKMMKKDMGGGAYVLALAYLIISHKLPVRLRVLVPAVENSVSDNAFRPQDIITARNGMTVEIGSTDAEGRLILADALTEAAREKPDFLLDVATLTGAARVALGTELPALFATDDSLARDLTDTGIAMGDGLWHMPLWEPYEDYLRPDIADIGNTPNSGYGGAITAALFLKNFIGDCTNWMHIDTMGWNLRSRPGRPSGGEALALQAVYAMLEKRYTQ